MNWQANNWWAVQPRWLKLTFVFVALPAWAYIVVGDLSGRDDGLLDWLAFATFALVALAFIFVERRKRKGDDRG